MGLFRQKKEATGSIDLTDHSKDASRSRFSFHRRGRDESNSRSAISSPSEVGPMTQRVLRASPQSKEDSSDIRPAPRSGLLFKSRSDSNDTGLKDSQHHFSNKRSEPAIPNLSRSRSPPQIYDRHEPDADTDHDVEADPSPKIPRPDPKSPTTSTSPIDPSPNVGPNSSIKTKTSPIRSPVLPVSTPVKDEKAGKRSMIDAKTPPSRPPSKDQDTANSSSKTTDAGADASSAKGGSPPTSVPLLSNEASSDKERRRVIPAKPTLKAAAALDASQKATLADGNSTTPLNSPTASATSSSAAGGGILKKSALKSPPRALPKVVNSPATSSSVTTKTEDSPATLQPEVSNAEQIADLDTNQPSSPHNINSNNKASSSSTHIRRISLNECDRPSPKATARKATFAPSAIRTQVLRSCQPDATPPSPAPSKSKSASVTTFSDPVLDLSPSDSSTQATPTEERNVSSEPPALSKILKSSYAFDPDRRGNLGSPFACPGFDNEGSANELLKALTMRRMKTIKMEKSWAGVGAQDDDSEEDLPSSRVKIIPRKGQL